MSVNAQVQLTLTVRETVAVDAAGYVSSSLNTVTYNGGNTDVSLTSSTTPTVNAEGVGIATLSGGAVTLDLTAATGLNGVAVSFSGKAPRAILFENPAANANAITIAKGASNGYTGLGASFSLTLQPKQKALVYLENAGTAVSGTVKTFDLTGTGAQFLKYQLIAG